MATIKEQPALPFAPPLHYDPGHNLLQRWVTLSGTSITATLISPLVGRAKGLLPTWWIFSVLGAFKVWILLLTNKFVWSQLSSSPRGASPPLWHSLHLSCRLLSFPVFTCIHLIPLRTSTQGEICNFKSRNLPFFLSPLFLTATHLFP